MKLCRYSILLETSALDVSNTDGLAVRTSGAGATLALDTLEGQEDILGDRVKRFDFMGHCT
jgi:hypothetical protein